MFISKEIDKKYRTWKSHLLLIIKKILEHKLQINHLWFESNRKNKEYIDKIIEIIKKSYKEVVLQSANILDKITNGKDYEEYMRYIKNSQSTKDIIDYDYTQL